MVHYVATVSSQVTPLSFLALGADMLQEKANSPWGCQGMDNKFGPVGWTPEKTRDLLW